MAKIYVSLQTGGVCFNSTDDLEPDYPELYTVAYDVRKHDLLSFSWVCWKHNDA